MAQTSNTTVQQLSLNTVLPGLPKVAEVRYHKGIAHVTAIPNDMEIEIYDENNMPAAVAAEIFTYVVVHVTDEEVWKALADILPKSANGKYLLYFLFPAAPEINTGIQFYFEELIDFKPANDDSDILYVDMFMGKEETLRKSEHKDVVCLPWDNDMLTVTTPSRVRLVKTIIAGLDYWMQRWM